MKTHEIAGLQARLATADRQDLAAIVLAGLEVVWPSTEMRPSLVPHLATSFDTALTLIGQTLPGWGVALDGTAAVGAGWTCTLRDTGLRDDDEVIGSGHAATPPLAMIVALLQVLIIRSKGYT